MIIHLCKKSLLRWGPQAGSLVAALRDREHSPVVKDCLDRCQRCDTGALIAGADGVPLSVASPDALLAAVDELADDDE